MRAFGLVAMVVLFLCASALAEASSYQVDLEKSFINFSFKSTLHGVDGHAENFEGFIEKDHEENFFQGNIDVFVSGLTTEHKKRDENMYAMFEKDKFPLIKFKFKDEGITDPELSGASKLMGVLTIKEINQSLSIPVSWTKKGNDLELSGESDLSLKELALKPPSVMGFIRVFDSVHVSFKIIYKEVR